MNPGTLPQARMAVLKSLEGRQAAGMMGLAFSTGFTVETVRRELDVLIGSREIEVLRPFPSAGAAEVPPDELVYFRLIRDTDDKYLWQQRLQVLTDAGETDDARMGHIYEDHASLISCDEREAGAGSFWSWLKGAAAAFMALPCAH